MSLQHLEIHQFRNLSGLKIELDPGFQVVYGENTSGKTSILEAIHVLCSGKSFLSASPRKMQKTGTNAFSLRGDIYQIKHPRQTLQYRWENNHIQLKVGYEAARRASEYASIQPVQAVSPLSYRFIDNTPDIRRKFLDWGVFHVEQSYPGIWRQFQRAVTQRNSMLSRGTDNRALSAWSQEYVKVSEKLDGFRQAYIEKLIGILQPIADTLLPDQALQVGYSPGWDRDKGLARLLEDNFIRDTERKYTYFGPQRADLVVRIRGSLARDIASRGQKKLITFALYLAQATLQQEIGHREGLLLIDDLPSELDTKHLQLVLGVLSNLPMQVIVSCIDASQLGVIEEEAKKRFHVKQGRVTEVV